MAHTRHSRLEYGTQKTVKAIISQVEVLKTSQVVPSEHGRLLEVEAMLASGVDTAAKDAVRNPDPPRCRANVAHTRQSRPESGLRANMVHIRQSRPESGLDFQVKVLKTFQVKVLETFRVVSSEHGRLLEVEAMLASGAATAARDAVPNPDPTLLSGCFFSTLITGPRRSLGACGIYKAVKARIWPGPSCKGPPSLSISGPEAGL